MPKAYDFSGAELQSYLAETRKLHPDSDGDVCVSHDAGPIREMLRDDRLINNLDVGNRQRIIRRLEEWIESCRKLDVINGTKEEGTMKEKAIDQAVQTGEALKDAGAEGLKQAGAKRGGRKLVSVIRSRTGSHHPEILNTPVGRRLEPMLLAGMTHYLAGLFDGKIPHAKGLQRNCERIVTGEMAEVGDDLLDLVEPLITELAGAVGGEEDE